MDRLVVHRGFFGQKMIKKISDGPPGGPPQIFWPKNDRKNLGIIGPMTVWIEIGRFLNLTEKITTLAS